LGSGGLDVRAPKNGRLRFAPGDSNWPGNRPSPPSPAPKRFFPCRSAVQGPGLSRLLVSAHPLPERPHKKLNPPDQLSFGNPRVVLELRWVNPDRPPQLRSPLRPGVVAVREDRGLSRPTFVPRFTYGGPETPVVRAHWSVLAVFFPSGIQVYEVLFAFPTSRVGSSPRWPQTPPRTRLEPASRTRARTPAPPPETFPSKQNRVWVTFWAPENSPFMTDPLPVEPRPSCSSPLVPQKKPASRHNWKLEYTQANDGPAEFSPAKNTRFTNPGHLVYGGFLPKHIVFQRPQGGPLASNKQDRSRFI